MRAPTPFEEEEGCKAVGGGGAGSSVAAASDAEQAPLSPLRLPPARGTAAVAPPEANDAEEKAPVGARGGGEDGSTIDRTIFVVSRGSPLTKKLPLLLDGSWLDRWWDNEGGGQQATSHERSPCRGSNGSFLPLGSNGAEELSLSLSLSLSQSSVSISRSQAICKLATCGC